MQEGKPIILGLAGYGTVGTGLARILDENASIIRRRLGCDIRIKTILVRDTAKHREYEPGEGAAFTETPMDLVSDPEIDIVVELMGGMETAYNLVTLALESGKHVVTANKHLLAERGQELFALAEEKGLALYYEASSVGGVPVIEALRESLAANRIDRIVGIVNGTANFILSEMTTSGLDFDTALDEATALGYAEADPSFDVDGFDTAHKLVLLTRLGFGVHHPLERLPISGIRETRSEDIEYAREFGYRVKLIGQVKRVGEKIEAGVYPALVRHTYLMARVGGNYNAVRIEGNAVGPIMLHGQGAGGAPTASAVLSDIIAIIKSGDNPNNTGWKESPLPAADILDPDLAACQHYLRFMVQDRHGVLAAVTRVFSEKEISIARVIQKGDEPGQKVDMVMITHEAPVGLMREALAAIDAMDFVVAPTVHYRIL